MTKADVRAKMNMICNLAAQIKALKVELVGIDTCDDGLWDGLDDLSDGTISEAEALEVLNEYYDELDEGEDTDDYPSIVIDPQTLWTKLILPVAGGALVAENCCSDFDTRQMCLMYQTDAADELDIALAEVKRGEQAEIDGKPADNRDIDVYEYSDVYSEDWQSRFTLKREEIEEIFGNS